MHLMDNGTYTHVGQGCFTPVDLLLFRSQFATDCCVGVDLVRRERLHGHGQSVAVPRMAGCGVPLSCAHDNVPHVSQACGDEDYLPGTGEPFPLFALTVVAACFRVVVVG